MFLLQFVRARDAEPARAVAARRAQVGAASGFGPWQLVTYAFLHGGLLHLVFNMFALYMFGGAIERVFGGRRYLTYYLVCVVSAALTQLASPRYRRFYPTVGASGGVFGLLLAYAIYFPNNRVMLMFPPIPMRARDFVVVYAALELVLGVTGDAGRRRALRAPGRHDRRLRDAALLARLRTDVAAQVLGEGLRHFPDERTALAACAGAHSDAKKRSERKSVNARTLADRCRRLGYTT